MEEVPPLPDDVLELGRRLIPRPVFIVGCARSGTSILGEALARHPGTCYLFEVSRVWSEAVPARDDHRLEPADATPAVARAVYEGLAAAARDEARESGVGGLPPRWVLLEKNPKHVLRVGFLARLFPHGRFLHIVRDGRDVVASLMFRNRGPRWGHLEIPGWRELLARYPEANHVRCAHQWRDAVRCALAEGRPLGPGRYLEVRYEELVRRPADTVEAALGFCGLATVPEVSGFLERIQDATEGSYHARRQVRHYVENHRVRIGRYRENLDARQLTEVEEICGDLLADLGYIERAPGSSATLGDP